MEVEFTMKKFRILLMMVLCLAFASTAAFAAAANKAVDNVVSMHGQIVSINDDMITIKDTNSDNTVALIVPWGMPHSFCAMTKMSFHNRASRCDSIFGR